MRPVAYLCIALAISTFGCTKQHHYFAKAASADEPTRYSGYSWLGFRYYTFADLTRDILANHARTVAQAIAVLPDEFRRNFTLVKHGSALQSSSKDNPRAILFGDTGHLVITFNGAPNQSDFDAFETAEFDEPTNRIIFRGIVFKGDADNQRSLFAPSDLVFENSDIAITKADPAICMGCHGRGGFTRYIWDGYKEWPTAFGAIDDGETAPFLQRKRAWMLNPRYRELFQDPGTATGYFPYHDLNDMRARNLGTMPNTRLGLLLTQHYARQMADILKSNPLLLKKLNRDLRENCWSQPWTSSLPVLLNTSMQKFGFPFYYPTLERKPPNPYALFLSGFDVLGTLIAQDIIVMKYGLHIALKEDQQDAMYTGLYSGVGARTSLYVAYRRPDARNAIFRPICEKEPKSPPRDEF